MCADYRNECMANLPLNIKNKISLPEISREYALHEIATITSAGPAILGLKHKGESGNWEGC